MERVCVEVQEITKESLKFEILQGDDFCSVLNRYMSEQKLTVNIVYAVAPEPSARTFRATLPHFESHLHGR